MNRIKLKYFLPFLIIPFSIIMGVFVQMFIQFSLKIALVFLFSLGFSFVMFLTQFSRRIIYFCFCVGLILYLDFYLVHVEHTGIVHGISLSVIDFLMIILLFRRMMYPEQYAQLQYQNNYWKQGIGASLFLLTAFSLSIINSLYPILTLYALIHYIKLIIFMLLIIYDFSDKNDFLEICTYLTCALLIINMYCIFQYVTKINITMSFNVYEEPDWYEGPFVPVGPVGSANITAGQIIGLTPFALATAFRHPKIYYRLISILILCISLVVLFLTNSRASWGIFLMSSLLMLFLLTLKRKISYKYLAFVIIMCVIAGIAIIPIILKNVDVNELTDLQNIYARFNLLQTSFMMVMDHPFLGVGLNTYTKLMMDYIPSIVLKFEWNYLVHNKYMLVWSETGTLGIIAYLVFLFVIYKLLLKYIRKYNDELVWIVIAILCSLFSMNCHMMFESYSGGAIIFLFWMLCGFSISINRLASARQSFN